ncbi:MAG TPA: kelch repeat-containing protein [Kofleriaceae bacterium]|nr:kelch repeat-containing protein [Kofleriaceae bacterium]
MLDYSVATNTWAELPALPTPRSDAAASRREDGTFFVAGGLAEQGVLGDVYALRLGSQTWELRAPMPTPRAGCAYGELFGELVCAGGDQGGAASRAVESYDPTLNEWTVLPELPVERAGAPGAIATSRLFVIGGSPSMAFEPTSTLFELDVLATIPR